MKDFLVKLRYFGMVLMTTILDFENLFSDEQAVTVSAASTNLVDLGTANQRHGSKRTILVTVTEAFLTLTSVTLVLQSDATAAFGSPAVVLQSRAIVLADLTIGAQFEIPIPKECEQFVRMYYTVAGTAATAGKVTAGIILDAEAAY